MQDLVLRLEEVFVAQRTIRDGAWQDERVVNGRAPDVVPFIPQVALLRTFPERESKQLSLSAPDRTNRTTAAIATMSNFARAWTFRPFRLLTP